MCSCYRAKARLRRRLRSPSPTTSRMRSTRSPRSWASVPATSPAKWPRTRTRIRFISRSEARLYKLSVVLILCCRECLWEAMKYWLVCALCSTRTSRSTSSVCLARSLNEITFLWPVGFQPAAQTRMWQPSLRHPSANSIFVSVRSSTPRNTELPSYLLLARPRLCESVVDELELLCNVLVEVLRASVQLRRVSIHNPLQLQSESAQK